MEKSKTGRIILLVLGTLIALCVLIIEAEAQSTEGFIYGKIHTDGNTYVGQIRWGTEEALWIDHFNASKTTDSYSKHVTEKKDQDESWFNFDWNLSSIWDNKSTIHQFICQFGDIREIVVLNKKNVKVILKNGIEIKLNGDGYNDIGDNIVIADSELGNISVKWDRITRIEFLPTPSKLPLVWGAPLYGTVYNFRNEKFTGFILWDNDERMGHDILDGSSADGKMALKFSDIISIGKYRNGSNVKLKSGREFYLTGSNDVSSGHRGVYVFVDGVGLVSIPWSSFEKVIFSPTEKSPPAYDTFERPKALEGNVKTFDREFKGKIIFDIDEAWTIEMLEGKDNETTYNIPFRYIKSIKPKNDNYSQVELKNGQTLLLGDMRDVSSKNSGLLVFDKGKSDPAFISWRKIDEIVFN